MNIDNLYIYKGEEIIDPTVYFTYYLLCIESEVQGCSMLFDQVKEFKVVIKA